MFHKIKSLTTSSLTLSSTSASRSLCFFFFFFSDFKSVSSVSFKTQKIDASTEEIIKLKQTSAAWKEFSAFVFATSSTFADLAPTLKTKFYPAFFAISKYKN